MAVYTIGDLHLSLGGDHSMNVFPGWENYVERIKQNWQEQKEEQARERKRQNDLKKTEERITALEERDNEIDTLMGEEEIYTNSVKCQELAEEKADIARQLEELYEQWETLAE